MSPVPPASAAAPGRPVGRGAVVGWSAVALLLAYAAWVHHGVAPSLGSDAWWEPRTFLLELRFARTNEPGLAVALMTLPAVLATVGIFAATASCWARALALSATVTVALFAFYGFAGRQVWVLFGWRGTAVVVATGLAVGFALAAPWLARSLLRQRPIVAAVLYVPLALAVIACMRHITGTDPRLVFNVSPWPAFSVIALDVAVYAIAGAQLGVALLVGAAELWGRSHARAAMLVAAGLLLPGAWLLARHPLPTSAITLVITLGGVSLLCAVAFVVRGTFRASIGRPQRITSLALGAALACFPVVAGQSLAAGDYAASRFVRAQTVIDALAAYYERESVYPDALDELVAAGDLESIPVPRVGFDALYDLGWLDPVAFGYQNLGSSYILEFEATQWVQCAYNPPWTPEEDEIAEDEEDAVVEEAWSCPDARPELW